MNESPQSVATEALDQARVIALQQGRESAAIPYLEKALILGLPKAKQLEAHNMLAGAFREIAGNSGLPASQMEASRDFSRAIEEFERAANLDREGSFNYFSDPLHRASLRFMDFLCLMRAGRIRESEGRQSAIAFLEDKTAIYNYLPSHPLLQCLSELGKLYEEEGNPDLAAQCWQKIVDAEPVDRWDERGKARELALKEFARQQQSKAKGSRDSPSTRAPKLSGAFLLLVVLGGLLGVYFSYSKAQTKPNKPEAKPVNWASPPKLSIRGLGPIRIGMSLVEAGLAAGTPLIRDPSESAESADCFYVKPSGAPNGLEFMVTNGRISRIDINSPLYSSISGLRIGQTQDQIIKLYPGKLEIETLRYEGEGTYLTYIPKDVADQSYRMIFVTDGKRITRFRAGKLPEVQYVEGCL
jgi:tetratricopeptide (TPR) repeat protein